MSRVSAHLARRKTPPGPRGYLLLGVLPHLRRHPLQFLTNVVQTYGDVVRLRLGPQTVYLLSHPDHVKYVLQDNQLNYRKALLMDKIKPFLGEGLATSDGAHWRQQRRIMQPLFHRDRLAAFATVVTEVTTQRLDRWQSLAQRGEALDILEEMMQLTGAVIMRTMLGADISASEASFTRDFHIVSAMTLRRLLSLTRVADLLPLPYTRRYRRALHRLDATVYRMIEARQCERTGQDDLLSMLLQARDAESGETMSAQQIRDEVMTIFFAGHETTGLALTWTWVLLAQHPEVAARLRAEVHAVLGRRLPTATDVAHLPYTRMVIQEAMRLYPPAWVISRTSIADDEIGGYHIPGNTALLMSPYITHRRADIWTAPTQCMPERFAPAQSVGRPRYAYFPFAGGPRQCIGEQFAMLEAQLVVAMVAAGMQFTLAPGSVPEPCALLTLRPRHPVRMLPHRL